MAMQVIKIEIGSPEWKALRTRYKVASEAPVMMGASPHMTRSELLHLKSTGIERAINEWVEKFVFKRGHDTEAKARPIAEDRIGDKLYPLVGVNHVEGLDVLASYDGITVPMYDLHWEHKQYAEELFTIVSEQRVEDLPMLVVWQLEHQLLVNENSSCILTVSDGTTKKYAQLEYHSVPERRRELIQGWKIFDKDLENYVAEEIPVEPVGAAIKDLPALAVEIRGEVIRSNLPAYRANVMDFIKNINTDLQTDQDFADAKKVVTFLEEKSKQLKAKEREIIAQASSVDEVVRTVKVIVEEMDKTRLQLDKLIKSEEQNRKTSILNGVKKEWLDHCAAINATLPGNAKLPTITPEFAQAVKSRRTLATYKEAARAELLRVKIAANNWKNHIEANLAMLAGFASEHMFLFNDLQGLITKDMDALEAIAKQRMAEHKAKHDAQVAAQAARLATAIAAAKPATTPEAAAPVAPAPTPRPTAPSAPGTPVQGELIASTPPATAAIKSGGGIVSFGNGSRPDYSKAPPTDRVLITALAAAFNVSPAKALDWIAGVDVKEARKWAAKQAM